MLKQNCEERSVKYLVVRRVPTGDGKRLSSSRKFMPESEASVQTSCTSIRLPSFVKYGTIVVEALNVAGMSRSTLAKQILDCSWSEFFRMHKYKAADAGRRIEEIDPRYTSQQC